MSSGKLLTLQEFITKSELSHGLMYDYSLVVYKNSKIGVEIICYKHGSFWQSPGAHLRGQGCPICGKIKSKLATTSNFVNSFPLKAAIIHNNKYNYDNSKYINSSTLVEIICLDHGSFWQSPNDHLAGKGCKICEFAFATEEFIQKCIKIHGSTYDYKLVNYTGSDKEVEIICFIHGIFLQIADSHLRGATCFKCARIKVGQLKVSNKETFVANSNIIHGHKYDYSKVNYVNNRTFIIIICPNHGEFKQTPNAHLCGARGCAKCSHHISKPETEWLNFLKIPLEWRQIGIKVNNRDIRPDAIDINNKIIWEFNGDYFHGNPKFYNADDINPTSKKTFGKLYQKTLDKEDLLKNAGYKVISIWESEWKIIRNKI